MKSESHKLLLDRGYIIKNGCEWDSNPCPHQRETCPEIDVATILKTLDG